MVSLSCRIGGARLALLSSSFSLKFLRARAEQPKKISKKMSENLSTAGADAVTFCAAIDVVDEQGDEEETVERPPHFEIFRHGRAVSSDCGASRPN